MSSAKVEWCMKISVMEWSPKGIMSCLNLRGWTALDVILISIGKQQNDNKINLGALKTTQQWHI